MSVVAEDAHDVMMVCSNGHVVTDRLRAQPELQRSRCEQCGAPTLHRCRTCGTDLPGAMLVADLVTVGQRRPPAYCSACGAAFPWTKRRVPKPGELWPTLEAFLRRVPRTVWELNLQAGDRPPFHVNNESDLEYLLRALLPLCCDEIHLASRTPGYCDCTRTDFSLLPDRIALTVKLVRAADDTNQLRQQLREDVGHYQKQKDCRILVALVFDAEGLVPEPIQFENEWSGKMEEIEMRCIVAR